MTLDNVKTGGDRTPKPLHQLTKFDMRNNVSDITRHSPACTSYSCFPCRVSVTISALLEVFFDSMTVENFVNVRSK